MRQINESIKMRVYKRKLLYGVGFNDADYVTEPRINGKQVVCAFYKTWKNMFGRCYSDKLQSRYPTYIGCSVCDEWLIFSNFKRWMESKDFEGKHLDKDLKVSGNKVYGPDNCMLVSQAINNILNDNALQRGVYPQGVSFNKPSKKYRAYVKFSGKFKHLGLYTTIKEAELAYLTAKHQAVKQAANDEADQEVSQALHMQAGLIFNKLQVVGALD